MKKTISLLLFCVMCAGLWGGALAEGIEILVGEMHKTYEADGTVLAALDAFFPQLAGMEDAASMERVNAAIAEVILTEGGYAAACEYALEDYTDAPERFAENEYGLKASAGAELLNGGALLAVRYDFVFYSGGPHP